MNDIDARSNANALAICNMRGRSHSPHSSHRCHSRHGSSPPDMPHIPPKDEEVQLIVAKEQLKRKQEEDLMELAVQKWKSKQIEEAEHEKHIIEDARLREHEKEEIRKAEFKAQRERWAAEELAKKTAAEEAKKKRDKEIEVEVRTRMAKAGYHNEDIEKVVEGKTVHYCHEHHQPHPCSICISTTAISSSVSPKHSYYRIRRDRICTETLRHFGVLFDPDPVR